ncbi:hypothetical protein Tco_0567704 [Tanacetum coccineum]
MGSNEETNAAGTDTRPPMLVESDYDSWKIRIHRYIRGKPNGKLIWKSIQNGPTPHPMITDPPPTDSTIVPAPRKKLDSEFSEEENKLEMADTQAEIILSQGLPRHIFNNLNQTSTAKEIWDNVEMLMQGSGRTIQQRKEDLFDEYERFRAIGNESIHDYFVRFHKLVNDMKITQLNIPTHQMNTKFVNNLPAYWGKYVTNVKQNMDISTTPYVQIYTHLKAYEPHAKKTLKKQEQSASIVDPLAYVAHTNLHLVLSSPHFPPTQHIQLRLSLQLKGIIGEGHVARLCKKTPREIWSLSTSKIKLTDEAKEKGDVLDAVADAFLADCRNAPQPYDQPQALTTTTCFKANSEDGGYDSDVDEGPNALLLYGVLLVIHSCITTIPHPFSKFMRSLNDIKSLIIWIIQIQEMHQEEHLDSVMRLRLMTIRFPEHTKVLELEAEVLKQQKMVIESEKRNSHLQKNHIDLQLKFQNYKQCIDTSSASNAIFEINKLRDQLQGKDTTIRNLDAQINIMKVLNVGSTAGSCDQQALETDRIQLKDTITSLRIQLDGLKVEHVSLQRRYDELTKANTHSRTANTEKLSALTAENTKLKAQVTGKTCSGPSTSETPKVLAPGMYNLGSKYIPPPKRVNWAKPTPLPKKKQVTFSEPPKPSLKPPQKPVVHPNKQTNVCVPMSTGVKPTSGASKTVPKRVPQNHSTLPAKSANARRVEAHPRTLNKKNRVDSNLLVKHSVSVSRKNNVCGACNKSLVFANHNDCLVMCDDSVNVKPHQTKRRKHQPKKEWKPIKRVWKPISKPVTKSKPQWQPTGRHFSLFEKYPLTRIMEPTDMPIELPPSASSSPKITMVSRFTHKLSDHQAGSKGISGIIDC